jgi:pimeloyl-ACP methyl ester carboxylesterase
VPPVRPTVIEASDGTALACWDLGGDGPPALLVHGNGLVAPCWAPMVGAGAGIHAYAVDLRGHGASGPSPDGAYPWARFADDLLAIIDGLELGPDLVGVGHSCGATSLLLAARQRPDAFAAIWAWEPIVPVPGGHLGPARSEALADRASRRRSSWPSEPEARAYLEGRGMFAEFAPAAFEAYLHFALVSTAPGSAASELTLACAPETEAAVFRAAPSLEVAERLPQVSCAVRVLGGGRPSSVPASDRHQIVARLPRGEASDWEECGHFGPFQVPAAAAADLRQWLAGGAIADAGHTPSVA